MKSLLLILQLPEFLGPKQICFLIDFDDQSLFNIWKVLDNFGNKFVCSMTCERFVDNKNMCSSLVIFAVAI